MEEILTAGMKESLKESFSHLKEPVTIMVFTKKGVNEQFNDFAATFIKELSGISPKIKAELHSVGDAASKKYSVERSPTLLIAPEKYSIRYTGAPLGEEARSFILAVVMASTGEAFISGDSKKRLRKLRDKRHVRVFVSPT